MRQIVMSRRTQALLSELQHLSSRDRVRVVIETAAQIVEGFSAFYPTDIFPEPPPGQHGDTVDACSASAIRHVLPAIADRVRSMSILPSPLRDSGLLGNHEGPMTEWLGAAWSLLYSDDVQIVSAPNTASSGQEP